jgi:transketolase
MLYADILRSLMQQQPAIVVLTAEARNALGSIPKEFPDRFYDFGIAEQNMLGAAAGMSAMGKIPVVHSPLATFVTMRSFEQIRSVVALQEHNVKIPGLLPGFSAAFQGPTHISLEDISLMRSIPGVTVMEAACQDDLAAIMQYAFSLHGCVYFRIPADMPERMAYLPGSDGVKSPRLLRRGKDGLVVASGAMVPVALEAAGMLAAGGLELAICGLCLLDPAPADELIGLIKEHRRVATIEEHFVTGGLGSIVAEVIADAGIGSKLLRMGIADKFPERCGGRAETLASFGLDAAGVAASLRNFFS